MKSSIIIESEPEYVNTISLGNTCEDMETNDSVMFYEIDGCVALSPSDGEIHLDRSQIEALSVWLSERAERMSETV